MTFEEFAAARLSGVLRFAGVLTADRALAEDVVQEVPEYSRKAPPRPLHGPRAGWGPLSRWQPTSGPLAA